MLVIVKLPSEEACEAGTMWIFELPPVSRTVA
jgi:hypothetical protein